MEALGIDQKGMEHGSAQHRQLMTGTFGEGQGQPWGLGGGRNLPVKLRDDPVLQQFRGLSRLSTDQANPIKVKLFPCGIISKDRMRKIKNCSNDNNDKPNINKRKSCGGLWTFQATSRPDGPWLLADPEAWERCRWERGRGTVSGLCGGPGLCSVSWLCWGVWGPPRLEHGARAGLAAWVGGSKGTGACWVQTPSAALAWPLQFCGAKMPTHLHPKEGTGPQPLIYNSGEHEMLPSGPEKNNSSLLLSLPPFETLSNAAQS